MKNTPRILGLLLLAAALTWSGCVNAATAYNQFVPANGILKGATTTPVTTAAAWSDVQLLLTGTCNSSVFVRGDGTCVAVNLTTGVSGTLPIGNGGTGVTSLGDLTRTSDTNVTMTLGGTPTGSMVKSTSLTMGWTGTLAAARGGLGMSTVTDDTLPVANGTTWVSTAVPSCADTGGNHLNYSTSTNAFSCGTSGTTTGAALTKTDDTNVTLTLGGSPTTALVNASSITAGWTGTLAAGRGGTGVSSLGNLTKADDTNVTLTLGGTPTGALVTSTSITAGWTGTLAAARGGLGMSTVTDDTLAVANGTTWQSKALTDCTDTSGNHLNYTASSNSFSCGTSSSVSAPTGANPTGTIGLTAVNGSAGTFTRSDGTAALSQAIAPTWSGIHTFGNTFTRFTAATPDLQIRDTGAATDAKTWDMTLSGGSYFLQTTNDALSASRNALKFDRTGLALTAMAFGNATDNPTLTLLGTGATTLGGSLQVNGASVTVNGTSGCVRDRYLVSGSQKAYVGTSTAGGDCISGDAVGDLAIGAGSGAINFSADNGTTKHMSIAVGGVQVGSPTGGAQGGGTVNATGVYINGVSLAGGNVQSGTFTGVLTGMTGTVNCSMKWRLTGSRVDLFLNSGSACTGTSNTTAMTMTGLPAAIQPSATTWLPCLGVDSNATAFTSCFIDTGTSASTIRFDRTNNTGTVTNFSSAAWTNSGTKGIPIGWDVTYDLRN